MFFGGGPVKMKLSAEYLYKFLILVLGLASLLVSASPAKAVVYGAETIDAKLSKPWVASIWYAEGENQIESPKFICSGSLIRQDIILTAAHCVFDTGFYFVKLKSDTLDSSNPLIPISATWRNPRYSDSSYVNDVGLLKLKEPSDVVPMIYASHGNSSVVAKVKNFSIFGWGLDQNENLATYLRTAKLSNQDINAKKFFGTRYFNVKTMIAAGTYIKSERVYSGGCSGDSGGPLVAQIGGREMIVGITSWGAVNCNTKAPTIFTRLPYYSKDINAGLVTIDKSSISQNRSPVENLEAPSISGNYVVGGELSCNPGKWSENVLGFSYKWTSINEAYGKTASTIPIASVNSYGTTYTCAVTGFSKYGSKTVYTSKTFYSAPSVSSKPLIWSFYNGIQTTVGTSGRCTGYFYGNVVSTSYAWYLSNSQIIDSSSSLVGNLSNLTITEEIKTKVLGGQANLLCLATASNQGGSVSAFSSVLLTFSTASNLQR